MTCIGTNGTITIVGVKYPCTLTDIRIHPLAPESPKFILQDFCFEIPFRWTKKQKRRFFSAAHPRQMRIHKKARGLGHRIFLRCTTGPTFFAPMPTVLW